MKTWRSIEMRQTDPDTNRLRAFCKKNGIRYEASDAGYGYVHFEILCDKETVNRINREVFTYWK